MKHYLSNLVCLFMLAALTLPGAAWSYSDEIYEGPTKDPIYTSFFSNTAAGGYDVTSYFTEGKPVKGNKAFKTKYLDADWYFTSRENLDKFVGNPERYAPQYGGYCAWAVAQGDIASGDPLLWTVYKGKLYLNYDKEINDRWLADKDKFIVDGDKNWPSVLN